MLDIRLAQLPVSDEITGKYALYLTSTRMILIPATQPVNDANNLNSMIESIEIPLNRIAEYRCSPPLFGKGIHSWTTFIKTLDVHNGQLELYFSSGFAEFNSYLDFLIKRTDCEDSGEWEDLACDNALEAFSELEPESFQIY
jgi:hypothetical protein